MRLLKFNDNCHLLSVGKKEILFSYETPVAGWTHEVGYFRTKEQFTASTSRHIKKYLVGVNYVEVVKQSWIESLDLGLGE